MRNWTIAAAAGALSLLGTAGTASAGSWYPLTNAPSIHAEEALLLTDGTVLVHDAGGSSWERLTPGPWGSLADGTWSAVAPLPAGYAPQNFASAVLPDGRVVVEGGELNAGAQVWTNLGAIYDPRTNTWTPIAPPSGWANVGDAQSAVLANGTLMLSDALSSAQALFNPSTLSWAPTGAGKADGNNGEAWTLLPSGKLLTVDRSNAPQSELYDPATGAWSPAGSTIAPLVDPVTGQLGPTILMADGRVFAAGGTSHTALYGTDGSWTQGPDFPVTSDGPVGAADAPAVLMVDGRVLVATSASPNAAGVHFMEFDGTRITEVGGGPSAASESTGKMYFLPAYGTQVLVTDGTTNVQVYIPGPPVLLTAGPTISSVPSMLVAGRTYEIYGTALNGPSQGVAHGGHSQAAANYPIVRVQNTATSHVFSCRTHDPSSMGVATGAATISTSFDVPAGIEAGPSVLQVVAGGVGSSGVEVCVQRSQAEACAGSCGGTVDDGCGGTITSLSSLPRPAAGSAVASGKRARRRAIAECGDPPTAWDSSAPAVSWRRERPSARRTKPAEEIMNLGRRPLSRAAALASLAALTHCAASSSNRDGASERVGTATAALELAPTDAECAAITVAGTSSVTRSIPLTPGMTTVFALDALPLGSDVFSATVYGSACGTTTGAPTWVSDPVTATVAVSPPVAVKLEMRRPSPDGGAAGVGLDFPGHVTEYSLPAGEAPVQIAVGPDGNLWFTESPGNNIGRITLAGAITEFPIPTANAQANGIAAGPDGNLWFTEYGVAKIGRITPAGAITEFATPTQTPLNVAEITAGPDGNLWFTEFSGKIGRVTPEGSMMEFDVPGATTTPWGIGVAGITTGPDGNLWFGMMDTHQIGSITPAGVFKPFTTLSNVNATPYSVVTGPDQSVWFTDLWGAPPNSGVGPFYPAVGRVTLAGAAVEFPLPVNQPVADAGAGGQWPGLGGITVGADGNVWFTEQQADQIGYITPAGAITHISLPTSAAAPMGIVRAPDGSIWFAENGAGAVAKYAP